MNIQAPDSFSESNKTTLGVSAAVVILGIAAILFARAVIARETIAFELVRDLAVTLCTIGLVSLVYELFLRRQLLTDVFAALEWRLDYDAKRLGIDHFFRDREEHSTALSKLLDSATTEVFLYALTMQELIGEQKWVLENLIAKGRRVRVLIFDGSSVHLDAVDKSLGRQGGLLEDIQNAGERYCRFRDELQGKPNASNFELAFYDVVPTFSMIAIDPDRADGTLFVEFYAHEVTGSQCPGMQLRKVAGIEPPRLSPFDFYLNSATNLWRKALANARAREAETKGKT